MIITSDLTFDNIGAEYSLMKYDKKKESYIEVQKKKWPTDVDDYKYYSVVQVSKPYVVSIYPNALQESKSPALDFAGIDIHKIRDILRFCNQYGLPVDPRFSVKHYNDYLFSDETLAESLLNANLDIPFNPHREIHMGLDEIASLICEMRNLVTFITSFENRDYATLAEIIIYFAFNEAMTSYRFAKRNFSSSLSLLQYNYAEETGIPRRYPDTINERILKFIDGVEQDTLETETDPRYSGDYSYPQHKHLLWQNIFIFSRVLLSHYNILEFTKDGRVIFDKPVDEASLFANGYSEQQFRRLSRAILIDAMNSSTEHLSPELILVDEQIRPNWNLESLVDAMYAELFFKMNPYDRFKKCANPSCNRYFSLSKDNSKKIYCSNSCAQLMAKRKQRARERATLNLNTSLVP